MSQLEMQNPPELDKPTKLKDKIVMIPVETQDFRKINEFAEASMIYRNPEKSEGKNCKNTTRKCHLHPHLARNNTKSIKYGYEIVR